MSFKTTIKDIFESLARFFSVKLHRRFCYLALIFLVALMEFFISGLVRRTFVFYSALEGEVTVEDRMLHRSYSRETDIRRYLDEVLLGPVSPDLDPLFPKETRLRSLLYRDGVVYADFTADAALPAERGDVFRGFLTLNQGIRRNFSVVKDVKLFIGGVEIFFTEFPRFFADSADIIDKTGQRALTN
jgi:hypothetical protein